MSFLAAGDFNVLPYNIVNLDKLGSQFQSFLDEQEKDILLKLLGGSLYDEFIAGLAENPIADRWVKLRDGDVYMYNNKNYKWNGMKRLLKPYIYSQWTRSEFEKQSGVGIVVRKAENAVVQNPSVKVTQSWNDFARQAGNSIMQEATLYGYLSVKGAAGVFDDTFDDTFTDFQAYFDFVFTDPGFLNIWDI